MEIEEMWFLTSGVLALWRRQTSLRELAVEGGSSVHFDSDRLNAEELAEEWNLSFQLGALGKAAPKGGIWTEPGSIPGSVVRT